MLKTPMTFGLKDYIGFTVSLHILVFLVFSRYKYLLYFYGKGNKRRETRSEWNSGENLRATGYEGERGTKSQAAGGRCPTPFLFS